MTSKKELYSVCVEELDCDGEVCQCFGLSRGSHSIRHISTDRKFVELLAGLVNRLDMEPARVHDLLEHLLP